jgi:glycosyltransferase involved in cell wall biosynthesis
MRPLVSILIPCYNAERWIAQAIESALAQTWPEKEVLVLDDGSTDDSLEIIRNYKAHLTWENGPNRGANVARNRLLTLAHGDWVQYLDADDSLQPEKIKREISFVQKHPETDLLFSPFILEHWSPSRTRTQFTTIPEPHDPWILLARWSLPGTGSGIWRKQAIIKAGGWDEQQPCCQEHELYLRLLMAGRKCSFLPEGGYVYRQWSEETLCKRDKPEVHRRRLAIEQRLENFLLAHNQLTPERLQAINQGRFETARSVWLYNPTKASEIMLSVRQSQPGFVPGGISGPWRYRAVFSMGGFEFSERLAQLGRWRSGGAHSSNRFSSPREQPGSATNWPHQGSTGGESAGLVSVLIPCHNAERWIGQAVESALAQSWRNKEVIVVDDGSTDNSLNIIEGYGARIRWETGPRRGGNIARNRLLALAGGNWLQYLDADDYLFPDKIANQMAALQSYPGTDVLFGPVILEYTGNSEARREQLEIPEPRDPWILLARWYLPQTGAPLWRKQAILDVGGWKNDQPCCQEHELYLRLLQGNKHFTYTDDTGAVYRQWSEQTVCKRDKPEVRRRRLEIERRAEHILRENGELTAPRLWAINMARFEMARAAWQFDQVEALRIMNELLLSYPGFCPNGDAAPGSYRLALRLFGFRIAETLADWRRQIAH